ncbi:nuclear transport factor 2 family protein [Streptomyces sp. NPDC059373]
MTTPTPTPTPAEGLGPLQELADRADLATLLARQGLWLDEQRFDDAGTVFTEDATVHTQGGRSQGLQAITAQARRIHADFAAIQHTTSGVLIDLDGDRATVRANLIAAFVRDTAAPEPAAVQVTPFWRPGDLATRT